MKKSIFLIVILFGIVKLQAQTAAPSDSAHRQPMSVLPKNALNIFPNPFINDLYITIKENGISIRSILIYDQEGTRVIEQTVQSKVAAPVKLNMAHLRPGVYYLVIETNRQPYRAQLVKNM